MNPDLRQLEYAAMRATIRERGTARMVLAPVIFIAWGAALIAVTPVPGTLVPLMILAAGFEAIFALHTNVERIGRYLQAYHEDSGGWEHVAMEFGRRFPGVGSDPLYSLLFVSAAAVNYVPAAFTASPVELGILGVLHAGLLLRIQVARRAAAGQRAGDLERFMRLRSGSSG